MGSPGAVRSMLFESVASDAAARVSCRAANLSSAACLAVFTSCPYSFLRSFSIFPISPKRGLMMFLVPRDRIRNCSSSSLFWGWVAAISSISCCTFANIFFSLFKV